jgi:peroxiredoxin (alkyl hydroperoxide reductase subunit C)
MQEIKRVVEALQVIDKEDVATPANWEPGDPVIIPSPKTTAELLARQRTSVEDPNINCVAWYMCFRDLATSALSKLGIYTKKSVIPPPIIRKP